MIFSERGLEIIFTLFTIIFTLFTIIFTAPLDHHYKTQCLKKVDLWNDELNELFLVRIEKKKE